MSALGQKRTFASRKKSCPLYPQKRTCAVQLGDVRLVPIADMPVLFDHLICSVEQTIWNGEAQRFGGLEIDH